MTTELLFLLLTAVLTGVLWIPVVIGCVSMRGFPSPADDAVAPTSTLPSRVARANRAHLNAVENLAPFAVVAQAIGFSTLVTPSCTVIYFGWRVLHVLFHISSFGRFKARTVAFPVGWAAFVTFAIALLRHAH
jgi:uncharacterized MAPEG superfamily protein